MGRNEEEIENRMENKRFRIVFEKKKKVNGIKSLQLANLKIFGRRTVSFVRCGHHGTMR